MSVPNASPEPPPTRLQRWLQALRPAAQPLDARERLRVVLGAGLGLLLTAVVSEWLLPHAPGLPWLVAPLGASAVLVFGVPASPLAQPWAVLAGNMVSALVGIACLRWIGPPELAAAVAVAAAIALMLGLRCLHPPGGAAALLMVLAGVRDWQFALYPVLANSLLLVAAGMVYNTLTGRRYPHAQQVPAAVPAPAGPAAPSFGAADLEAALARYNQVLDMPRDDLQALLQEAELQAYRRRLGGLRCADIMSRELKTVEFGTPLQDAWALLRRHRIKALPVVDRVHRVIGILTLADFMRAAELERHEGLADKLRRLVLPAPASHSDKPEVVGQIMTRQVRVASAERPLAELVPLFADTGHHHIPVVGAQARLVGIITQSDLVAALSRAG
ncbi:MAG TPA: HPP family protein [Roseateles sp.]|nr:HPP family protein [Roseateles sp.]